MSKFFHLSKKTNQRIRPSRKFFPAMKIDVQKINICLAVLIAVCGVSYLVQINSLATRGYQIKELENKITDLNQEKADLELQTLSLQSMGTVQEKVSQLGLVAAGEPAYLMPTPVALAR
ncbi:MAG: hypothetical protein WC675_01505 [Patescibacteria group bacterium]|jgi:cell division protein FtsL